MAGLDDDKFFEYFMNFRKELMEEFIDRKGLEDEFISFAEQQYLKHPTEGFWKCLFCEHPGDSY